MSKVDWKQKYMELRAKYMNAVDVAFRLGVEEGKRASEIEGLQQQIQQMEEAAAMAEPPMSGEEGMPDEGGEPPLEEAIEEGGEEAMAEEGDELGQSIDELEGYVKNEGPVNFQELMKSFHKNNSKSSDNANVSEKQKEVADIIDKWDSKEEQE